MAENGNGHSTLFLLLQGSLEKKDPGELVKKLAAHYPQKKLLRLLSRGDGITRKAAAFCLGLVGDQAAVPALVKALKDEESSVRSESEKALWALWFRSGNGKADTLLRQGAELLNHRKFALAKKILNELIETQPDFAEAYNQRAILFFLQRKWDQSIKDCQKVLELNPYHFGAMAGMGQCFLQKKEVAVAMEAFRMALEVNPNLTGIQEALDYLQSEQEG